MHAYVFACMSSCVHACVLICVSRCECLHVWVRVSAFMYVWVGACMRVSVCVHAYAYGGLNLMLSIFLVAPFSFIEARSLTETKVCQFLPV